jgi:hypothetical protein
MAKKTEDQYFATYLHAAALCDLTFDAECDGQTDRTIWAHRRFMQARFSWWQSRKSQ